MLVLGYILPTQHLTIKEHPVTPNFKSHRKKQIKSMESDSAIDHRFPNLFIKLLSLQAEIISTFIVSLASPFFSLLPPPGKPDTVSEPPPPGGITLLLGRIAAGLVAAAYACGVLMATMAAAAVLGVALVGAWAEKPVYARQALSFDYGEPHPTAVFDFGSKGAAGHTLYVSLFLLMPESDYNRDVGIFQLTAELLSIEGDLVAKSSRPCMLGFKSWPIRLTRTFFMGAPLLLGITTETQAITFPILQHKETFYPPQTEYIRITLIPRAGTLFLPQFYKAEIVVKSQPPWTKELAYNWKWTFRVWTTLFIFIMLVIVLVLFLNPLIFPVITKYEQESEALAEPRNERDASVSEPEPVKKLRQSRSKRKASSSPATSISFSGFEGSGDSSESVSFRGF